MQHILGQIRRCVEDYHMIEAGDRIAVGVSGGKDSLVLLCAMARLREFYPLPFTLEAITLHPGVPGLDFSPVTELCQKLAVPYTIVDVPIYQIVFEERKEKNPCSLCSKMRRGAINTALVERDIHKVALGHHFDDAVETMLMNLFFEGRLGSFQPVTYLDRMDVMQIRPMLYVEEVDVARAARREELPIIKNPCPADGVTRRQEVKDLLQKLEADYPNLRTKIFGAMQRYPLYGWNKETMER